MKKNKIVVFLTIIVIIQGCGIFTSITNKNVDVFLLSPITDGQIAVLNFYKEGNVHPGNLNKLVADWLTEELFFSGGFKVKDRSEVNALEEIYDINSTSKISTDQIKDFGIDLKAKYLIIGQIYSQSNNYDRNKNSNKDMKLSIRIIDTKTTSVIGIASIYEKDMTLSYEKIKSMISKIVRELES